MLLLSVTYNKRGKCGNKIEKTYSYAQKIFVSQTFHQNPIGINAIAIVSPWENVLAVMVEVFREKFWRLGDKVLSLPSDSKTNNQTEL